MRYNVAVRQLGQREAQKAAANNYRPPDVVFAMDCPALACKGRLDLEGDIPLWLKGKETDSGWLLRCDKCQRIVLVQQFPGEEAF